MIQDEIWKKSGKAGPLVATAIHDGHELRKEVFDIMKLSDEERLREEDPYTAQWTTIGDTQIIVTRSRFELDLNRPREKAVYQKPEDAWGLDVWNSTPSQELVARSLLEYDAFYNEVHQIFSDLEKRFGHFVVFDIHSYNHRRDGADGPYADAENNPQVNIGTGTMERAKWARLIDRFIGDLRNFDYLGDKLDVRENVKFKGGQFPKWIHQTFPDSACSISVEFKKFFMDEWSGEPDMAQLKNIRLALHSTLPGVLEELKKMR